MSTRHPRRRRHAPKEDRPPQERRSPRRYTRRPAPDDVDRDAHEAAALRRAAADAVLQRDRAVLRQLVAATKDARYARARVRRADIPLDASRRRRGLRRGHIPEGCSLRRPIAATPRPSTRIVRGRVARPSTRIVRGRVATAPRPSTWTYSEGCSLRRPIAATPRPSTRIVRGRVARPSTRIVRGRVATAPRPSTWTYSEGCSLQVRPRAAAAARGLAAARGQDRRVARRGRVDGARRGPRGRGRAARAARDARRVPGRAELLASRMPSSRDAPATCVTRVPTPRRGA